MVFTSHVSEPEFEPEFEPEAKPEAAEPTHLVGFQVVLNVFLELVDVFRVEHVVVEQAVDLLELEHVELMACERKLVRLHLGLVAALAFRLLEALEVALGGLNLLVELREAVLDPHARVLPRLLGRVESVELRESFFRVRFRLCLLLAHFELFHLLLNEPTCVRKRLLVLHVAVADPVLDLVAEALELLDLLLQVRFVFLLLVLRRRSVDFVPNVVEHLDALRHLLKRAVDLAHELPLARHRVSARAPSAVVVVRLCLIHTLCWSSVELCGGT